MNKLDLRYTNENEKRLIYQAIKIIDESFSSLETIKRFKKSRWAIKRGVYKRAFVKGNIVVKTAPLYQRKKEIKLWTNTRYIQGYRRYRKNLARIFGIYRGFVFQRRVYNIRRTYNCYSKCKEIAIRLGIWDWMQNHGHDINGNPVWFDSRM